MTHAPVIETNASNHTIRVVLMQNNHPIAFFSKKMIGRICAASMNELFTIIEVVAKWRHYLLGRTFIIRTDHRSLKHLMDQVIQMPKQHQYLNKLLGFNYTIVYKPGKKNNMADALSRIKDEQEGEVSVEQQLMVFDGVSCALSTITSKLLDSLRNEVLKNPKLQAIVQDCSNSSTS